MATKTVKKQRAAKVEFKGYLNVNLSAEEDLAFDAWFGDGKFDLSLLFDLIDFGYKISFAEDEFNDGLSVSVYAKSSKLSWAGWTLTAWAGTLEEAAALAFFKHQFVCNQDWDAFTGRPAKSHSKRG